MEPPGPGDISRMWDVQKGGKESWEIVQIETRRAEESRVWGRKVPGQGSGERRGR